MTNRHQSGTDHHHPALAQHAVGQKTSENRGQVHQAGVETIDL